MSEDATWQAMPTFKKPLMILSSGSEAGLFTSFNKSQIIYHKQQGKYDVCR